MPKITKQGKTKEELFEAIKLNKIEDLMFKIINTDYKLNHAICDECDCEFDYGYEESYMPTWTPFGDFDEYINCPNCGNEINVGRKVKMTLVCQLSNEQYKKYYDKALDIYNKEHRLGKYKPVNGFKNLFKRRKYDR